MSEYPKVIERPYKVYRGERDDEYDYAGGLASHHVEWTYGKSFRLESDAAAYAERISEDYEFVKIEKKESE